MKINRKNIIIAVVVIFFLIGIIPKIARYITTSLNAKETQYVAFVEKPRMCIRDSTCIITKQYNICTLS